MQRLSTKIASLSTALILLLFVLVPLGAVFIQSIHVTGPLPPNEIRALVVDALESLEPGAREPLVQGWLDQLTPTQKMEATAATLEVLGIAVTWDRNAVFAEQIVAAEKAVEQLGASKRIAFDTELPIQVVTLHKRVPLAFKIRDRISAEDFDVLRSGSRKSFSLQHHLYFLREAHLLRAAWHSLLVATITSLVTVILAYALAFSINRDGIMMPNLVRFVVLMPLVSPPIIMSFAAILLFGRQGLVTKGLLDNTLGLINADVSNLYGVSGVIIAMVLSYLPHGFIVLDNVLAQQDGRVEESAAILGANAWQNFRYVTLPLTRPGVIRAVLVVFILSLTDFGNPLVIGRGYPVLAGVIYDEIIGFQNTSLAASLCIWLIIPTLTAYLLFEGTRGRKRFATTADTGGPPELPLPNSARVGLGIMAALVCVTVSMFYGIIVVGSITRVWGVDFSLTLYHYRLHSQLYAGVSASGLSGDVGAGGIPLVWNSFKIAGIAALMGGIFSVMIAYLVERVRPWGNTLIGFVALLPAVVPGVIFGVGYLVAFNNPLGIKQLALTGTARILVMNVMVANIFVGVLAGKAMLQRLDASVDEAAEILGASMIQRFFLVILLMLKQVLLLATLYIFVHGMTTLSAVIFLVSPGNNLASVGIFLNAESGRYGLACSMSVVILLIVTATMTLFWLAERRGPRWAKLRLTDHASGSALPMAMRKTVGG